MQLVTCWAQFGLTFHLGSRKFEDKFYLAWYIKITAEVQFTELCVGPWGRHHEAKGW